MGTKLVLSEEKGWRLQTEIHFSEQMLDSYYFPRQGMTQHANQRENCIYLSTGRLKSGIVFM
jgi:hypothetical protein